MTVSIRNPRKGQTMYRLKQSVVLRGVCVERSMNRWSTDLGGREILWTIL